ncbi:hypothetical protein HPB50_028706 [Hyalomma asiaticum]|nr:hypothetical protein HPB50_028706 [Hyalomma asiaticum]
MDFGAGRFEVTFKNKESVDRFLAHPVIELKGSECKFEYRGVQTKVVRVFGFPKLEDAGVLAREMASYGKVLGVSEEYIPGWPEVLSGIRRVRIEMVRPVPNLLRVEDKCGVHTLRGGPRCFLLPGAHVRECRDARAYAGGSRRCARESEQNFPTLERPPQPKGPTPGEKVPEKGGEKKNESGLAEAVSSPAAEVVPASPANEAAPTASPDEPEQMELAGPSESRRPRSGAAKRRQADAPKESAGRGCQGRFGQRLRFGLVRRHQNQTTSALRSQNQMQDSTSTLVEESTEGERQPPCPMCGLSGEQCECSALSSITYSSTNEGSLIEESSSVA